MIDNFYDSRKLKFNNSIKALEPIYINGVLGKIDDLFLENYDEKRDKQAKEKEASGSLSTVYLKTSKNQTPEKKDRIISEKEFEIRPTPTVEDFQTQFMETNENLLSNGNLVSSKVTLNFNKPDVLEFDGMYEHEDDQIMDNEVENENELLDPSDVGNDEVLGDYNNYTPIEVKSENKDEKESIKTSKHEEEEDIITYGSVKSLPKIDNVEKMENINTKQQTTEEVEKISNVHSLSNTTQPRKINLKARAGLRQESPRPSLSKTSFNAKLKKPLENNIINADREAEGKTLEQRTMDIAKKNQNNEEDNVSEPMIYVKTTNKPKLSNFESVNKNDGNQIYSKKNISSIPKKNESNKMVKKAEATTNENRKLKQKIPVRDNAIKINSNKNFVVIEAKKISLM